MDTAVISENLTEPDRPVDLFDIEAKHNENECQIWMMEHWAIGWYCSLAYIIVIFTLKRYMLNRPRFELRYSLAFWSGSLAIFSLMGTVRMAPQFFDDLQQRGLHFALCDNTFMTTKPTSYWGYIFTLSKVIELGDTVFIVLRKQPLIFLHYYHHVTVLLYVWYSYPQRPSTSRWFALMNFAVHSIMYSYYTLRAMRIKVPRIVNILITFLQIVQMIIGLAVNLYTARMLQQSTPCSISGPNVQYALLMYFSYFVLFLKFFYDAYIAPNRIKQAERMKQKREMVATEDKHIGNGHCTPMSNGYVKNGMHKMSTSNGYCNGYQRKTADRVLND